MADPVNLVVQGWRDLVEFEFLRRALVAGVIVGATCAVLSVYVVLKKLAFIGQGISHSAFGGVALGLLLFQGTAHAAWGINGSTLVFCLIVALLIAATSRGRQVSEDTAIGIFLSVSMALGVLFVALRKQYSTEVFGYLFGSILAVSPVDLAVIGGLSAVVLLSILAFQKELYFFVFDEEGAQAAGMPVALLHYGLLTLLALTIVVSVKIVGIVLISAYLVIPGATALALARRLPAMMAISVGIGVVSSVAGLVLSNAFDIPSGATIVLTQFALFVAAAAIRAIQSA
ncbi:MAG: metal ABC transporter permease [Myxococcales bacterium]|nr:metal ABC transporter permease [Myxococcales bacterium]